ncbi:hypothetical protein PMAYCL1PPCAC_23131, partial [Pristionchus mayeri]
SVLSPDWSSMASSVKKNPLSKATSPWSPVFSSTVSTPVTYEPLSARRSSCETIPPGKSLVESVAALSLLGIVGIVLAGLQTLLGVDVIVANLALLACLFVGQWTYVHSYKLDPRCSIILDEANVLSITSHFEHEQLGFIKGYTPTVKLSESTEALIKPKSLWDALFFDDRQYKIEEFYKEMYGNEYANAKKKEEE